MWWHRKKLPTVFPLPQTIHYICYTHPALQVRKVFIVHEFSLLFRNLCKFMMLNNSLEWYLGLNTPLVYIYIYIYMYTYFYIIYNIYIYIYILYLLLSFLSCSCQGLPRVSSGQPVGMQLHYYGRYNMYGAWRLTVWELYLFILLLLPYIIIIIILQYFACKHTHIYTHNIHVYIYIWHRTSVQIILQLYWR